MVIFYIVSIMSMRVLQSVFTKRSYLELPEGIHPYVRYVTVSKFMAAAFALLSLFISGSFYGFSAQALLIAGVSGAFLAIGSFCGIKALSGGTIVLNSLFSTAGLLVPCILGVFIFDEPMSVLQVLSIGVLFVSMVLLAKSSSNIFGGLKPVTLICLIGSLLSNGMVMFCQKLFGFLQPHGNTMLFSFLTFLVPSVGLSLYILGNKVTAKHAPTPVTFSKKLYIYAAILSFAVFVIQQFVTLLTPKLPSVVLFSLVNGGATVIAAIVGAILYKEKLNVRSTVGMILGLLSLISIKIFE